MSGMTDLERTLELWLRADGPEDVPARVVRAAHAEARTIDQRAPGATPLPVWRREPGDDAGRPRTTRPGMALLAAALAGGLVAATAIVGGQPMARPAPSPDDRTIGRFTATGTPHDARGEGTVAVLLADGRVLVVDDYYHRGRAEVWDPATGEFTPAGSVPPGPGFSAAVALADGRVLVIGFEEGKGDPGLDYLWDPATRTFEPRDPAATGLPAPSLRPLAVASGPEMLDGRLVEDVDGVKMVWDPLSRKAVPAEQIGPHDDGPPFAYGNAPTMTALADGRVLVSGGTFCKTITNGSTGWMPSAGMVLAMIDLPSWGTVAEPEPRADRIMACAPTDRAAVWDPVSRTLTPAGPMTHPRSEHAAVLLLDGRVLLVGSGMGDALETTAEIFSLDGAPPSDPPATTDP